MFYLPLVSFERLDFFAIDSHSHDTKSRSVDGFVVKKMSIIDTTSKLALK